LLARIDSKGNQNQIIDGFGKKIFTIIKYFFTN
jgi:hypothetical protein